MPEKLSDKRLEEITNDYWEAIENDEDDEMWSMIGELIRHIESL